MANPVLFQWGPIQFQVFPLSMQDYAHHTAADWAKKEIAGAALYREWVGEGEEQITVKGKVFPHYFARAMRDSVDPNTGRRRDINQPILGPGASLDPETNLLREHTGGMPSSGGLMHLDMLDNNAMTPLFAATVQATEEAIINALVAAEPMTGINNHQIPALPHDQLQQVLRKYGRWVEPGPSNER